MFGNGLSGILTNLLKVFFMLIFPAKDTDTDEDTKAV